MSVTEEPEIVSNPRNEDFTKITFWPDLERFNVTEISDDFYALLVKRVYDLAGWYL